MSRRKGPWLYVEQAAELWGVAPSTWRDYVRKGYAPAPDDPDLETPVNRRRPRWRESTVTGARDARPGRGRKRPEAA